MIQASCINEIHSVAYGKKTIDFSLLYCDRKTLEIAVHPDGSIIVKAPVQADIDLIEKKIIKRARWIFKQLNYFKQFTPKTPERSYVSGESHLYLGRQYRLKINEGIENSVKLSRGYFHITCHSDPAPDTVKQLLDKWYLDKARLQFNESMDRCWQKFKHLDIDMPKLSIKRMRKRWGSLSKSRNITLNSDLIRAPKECIDYVVTHEFCHLKYHDHGPEFYRLLESVIPEWEKIKHRLELSLV